MISPPGTPRAVGKSRRGKCGRRPLQVQGEERGGASATRGPGPSPSPPKHRASSGVSPGSARPGSPISRPRRRSSARPAPGGEDPGPAAPTPSGWSTGQGDGTPAGRAPAPTRGARPAVPTLKPLFLSELSDLRPRQLRLGEAWVRRRPPSDRRRWGAQPPGLRDPGCRRPPALPNADPSFPVPGSPHLNFGGARAAKLSADLQRTPALAAHRAPGEEREGGGEGEGAGLWGGRGRAVARHLPALRVVQAATAAAAARTRGRGGAGSSALRSGHRRRGALLSSPAVRRARVRSRSHAAPAGPRRGGGGACSTCPSSPSPRPKLKNNKKQLITPKQSAPRRAEGEA